MNKNLPEIAQKIATELGCTVIPGGDEHRQQIGGGEVPFAIYSVFGTDKLSVSIMFPRTADGKIMSSRDLYPTPEDCSIKFSAGRKPEVIAADIKRRFFPAATVVYAACVQRVESANAYGAICSNNATHIKNLFTGSILQQETPNSSATVNFNTSGLHGFAKVSRDDVSVTLRGTASDITKMLALLAN